MRNISEIIEGVPLVFAEPTDSVRAVARMMTEKNVGAVPVLDAGTLAGIFSERDLMTRVVAKDLDPDTTLVSAIMTRELVVAAPDDRIEECLLKMHTLGCRHLPVIDDRRLVGMISLRDLLQVDNLKKKASADFLRELVTYSPDYES